MYVLTYGFMYVCCSDALHSVMSTAGGNDGGGGDDSGSDDSGGGNSDRGSSGNDTWW